MGDALNQFATQSDQQIFFSGALVAGLRTSGLQGRYPTFDALNRLLDGSGLTWSQTGPGVIVPQRRDAASAEDVPVDVANVMVTGTLLKNAGELASPVLRLNRDDLDARGAATVADVLAAPILNTPLTGSSSSAGESSSILSVR